MEYHDTTYIIVAVQAGQYLDLFFWRLYLCGALGYEAEEYLDY